jgi:dTDP-4-dehydrorhamnose 3,5-epimerase-like enzyme
MIPKIITGDSHSDQRGTLFYNNDFDALPIRRMYVIENENTDFVRAWQGHKIEQRWFVVSNGSFRIQLIAIDNWDKPTSNLETITFVLDSKKLDVLHVPSGYVSSIQSLEQGSKLLVMSYYLLGTIQDEYRYEKDYFIK